MLDLTDRFGRRVDYLRVSLTDRCNMRCVYCMPEQGDPFLRSPELLTADEIVTLGHVFAALGVKKIRLTGGEPLVRAGVPALVAALRAIPGIEHVALTTNALLLARHAEALHRAGLSSVNISLDSLVPATFARITRSAPDALARVIEGVEAARAVGIPSIKLNAVIVRGLNDREVVDLVRWAAERGLVMRFIEFMPIGEQTVWGTSGKDSCVSAKALREALASVWRLEPERARFGAGPARYWRAFGEGLPQEGQPVGVISAVTECFCDGCNRVRISSMGGLRACLADDHEVDLRAPLRDAALDEVGRQVALLEAIRRALGSKKERHSFDLDRPGVTRVAMHALGG
jgi:cyclic pyranopterin phosphate synthase